MDSQRVQRHLESLFQSRATPAVKDLIPVLTRWNEILASVPGLQKRRPGAHCRISGLSGGVLAVEADHPAWLQLLQWNEQELVERLGVAFPVLGIRSLQFRLSRPGDQVERPTAVMPEPVKVELSADERSQMDAVLKELESLIQKSPPGKKPD